MHQYTEECRSANREFVLCEIALVRFAFSNVGSIWFFLVVQCFENGSSGDEPDEIIDQSCYWHGTGVSRELLPRHQMLSILTVVCKLPPTVMVVR